MDSALKIPTKENVSRALKRTIPAFFVLGCFIALIFAGSQSIDYDWQWSEVPQYIAEKDEGEWYQGALIFGLIETVKISSISLLIALVGGLCLTGARSSSLWSIRVPAESFFTAVRNTPLLVQLYVTYFIVGPVLDMDRFWIAVLSLASFHAAYLAPIFKSGLDGIPRGQIEAAQSLGLPKFIIFIRILLPQAFRIVLPACTNEAVNLIKNSALLSAIAIFELVTEGKDIIADTFMSFEIWLTVGALYLLITLPLSSAALFLEKRLKT